MSRCKLKLLLWPDLQPLSEEPFETFETMTERERLILEDYTRPDFEQRLRAVKSMAAPKETPNITIINHCFTGWPKAHNASNSLSEEGSATTIEVPPPPYYRNREAVKKLLTQSDALRELTEKEKEVVKDYTESDLNLKEMSNKHQVNHTIILCEQTPPPAVLTPTPFAIHLSLYLKYICYKLGLLVLKKLPNLHRRYPRQPSTELFKKAWKISPRIQLHRRT